MIIDYWGEERLNHHTEATTMLYGARECARILLEEGIANAIARHRLHGNAMAQGLAAMNLKLFGDQSKKMHNVVGVYIPEGVIGEAVRSSMLNDFGIEIGTSFGSLHGKIWRIGTMGYNARKDAILQTLTALEAVLYSAGHSQTANAGVDAAFEPTRMYSRRVSECSTPAVTPQSTSRKYLELNHHQRTSKKVMHRCDQLAAISSNPENISRFYLTAEHKRCSELVAQWMQEAGMETWVDAAGNICGRYEAQDACAKTLILASHLDSIPNAGAYDGILGVLLAIAVVEQLHQNNIALPYAIDIIGFGDEEGVRFGSTLLGSRAVAGSWNPAWWQLKDRAGISLQQAFIDFGLAPENIHRAARDPEGILAYLEVHIEQGPVLENENLALGIVTAIAGARRFAIEIQGYAGHAGTVPMAMRKDALVGAALGIALVENIAKEFDVVATVGQIDCGPGAVNVIPGRARFTIDIRSGDDHQRDQAFAKIQRELDMVCEVRGLSATWQEIHNAPAVVCADWIQAQQAAILCDMEIEPYKLISGAGHDAMAMADVCDVAMYFVRCKGGVNHHPDESVTVADVALALDALG